MEEVERVMIRDALRRYRGHQKRTAAELGIGVRTLRTKIKKWRLSGEGRGSGDPRARVGAFGEGN
jgi:DNA-binding NtrC family response regulator